MNEPLILAPDLSDTVDAVIAWLSDEGGGQAEFSIGEHYAGYPTEVNARRIRIAAEVLADAVDAGCGGDFDIPDCAMVTPEIMAAVFADLDASEARAAKRDADRAAHAAADVAARAAADKDARRERRRAVLFARRAETFRRLLEPDSGASEAERAMAARQLGVANG